MTDLESAETIQSDAETEEPRRPGVKSVHKKIGEYTLLREIGHGTFATVYKARRRDGTKVAVKMFSREQMAGKRLNALRQEIKIMQGIVCENVTKLYAVMQTRRHYYLVMEYCSGGDLERVHGKQLGECAVQRIIHQLSKALRALNERNVVHRDLKPGNILLSSKKQDAMIKLADFGFARRLGPDEYTRTFCGTPLYMAPEILAGDSYGLKSDLWSIGVLMYLFLTGRFPFEGATPHQVFVALAQGVLRFPAELEVSDLCMDLMRSLLQVNYKNRIEWKHFFEHPFVSTSPEEYKALYPTLKKRKPHDSPATPCTTGVTPSLVEENKAVQLHLATRTEGDESLVLDVMQSAIGSIRGILETFKQTQRFSRVETYQREIFDLLWKTCCRIKPIISTFVWKENVLLPGQETSRRSLKVVGESREILVPVTPELVVAVQSQPGFAAMAHSLLELYDTIVSNLVGYADLLPFMQSYNSLWSLFRYCVTIGYEAQALEQSEAETKYVEGLFVIELILSEHYSSPGDISHHSDKNYQDYFFVNERDERVLECSEVGEVLKQQYDVRDMLRIRKMGGKELEYAKQIRDEFRAKYLNCINKK